MTSGRSAAVMILELTVLNAATEASTGCIQQLRGGNHMRLLRAAANSMPSHAVDDTQHHLGNKA